MFRILFYEPRIAGNTGAAIRLAAVTGAAASPRRAVGVRPRRVQLRRAGLDYHDLAVMTVHADFDTALATLAPGRVFAFTASGEQLYTDVAYQPGDVLLFGPEPTGLPDDVLDDPRLAARVRLPMLPGRRSMNLANTASIAVYEAWRQHDFALPD
ncbi:tRNA (cytidine(34)-2'-O)-methyltransferase [Aeromicrobium sp. UC242_57]|uniref:tRNA (cytidine(34)-2'-O)-methyltransferase n=1 Tax=Aeromicrobium sp. UC242_57 TaxID=3374624 RepID=UPI0037AA4720